MTAGAFITLLFVAALAAWIAHLVVAERRARKEFARLTAVARERCPRCAYCIAGAPRPMCPECGLDFSGHSDDWRAQRQGTYGGPPHLRA